MYSLIYMLKRVNDVNEHAIFTKCSLQPPPNPFEKKSLSAPARVLHVLHLRQIFGILALLLFLIHHSGIKN